MTVLGDHLEVAARLTNGRMTSDVAWPDKLTILAIPGDTDK
jgi:hypothetical protein